MSEHREAVPVFSFFSPHKRVMVLSVVTLPISFFHSCDGFLLRRFTGKVVMDHSC